MNGGPTPPSGTNKRSFTRRLRRLLSDIGRKQLSHGGADPYAKIRPFFDGEFYLLSYQDVAEAGVDPLVHYDKYGWREGRDPNEWFSTSHYLARFPDIQDAQRNPLFHFAAAYNKGETDAIALKSGIVPIPDISDIENTKLTLQVATPPKADVLLASRHFDVDYYLEQSPEIAKSGVDAVVHYLAVGWILGRDPSPDFSTSYYLKHNNDIRTSGINPYLHYLKSGHKESWRRAASVKHAQIFDLFEQEPPIEQLSRAKELEPMVALPEVRRNITSPISTAGDLLGVVQSLRRGFAGDVYEHIILIPHVRMSGAARVAGEFTKAYSQLYGAENILLVTTDLSDFEHPEWFPEDVRIFDLSAMLGSLSDTQKITALIDLLRGVEGKRLININSRLCWDTLRVYGRQLSQEFFVSSYLFTWEETVKGSRVGYPIQWLRDTVDFNHLIYTDTKFLARDIRARFGLEGDHSNRVAAIYTPFNAMEIATPNPEDNKPSSTKRALWAGRFDRQKRVDLLIDIARKNPHIEFWAYGKPVLDSVGIEGLSPPSNIKAMGTYEDFSKVLENGFDFFLYTSQWDGLPTILLDVAQAELPIVAPDVGGIAEIIGPKTGWRVDTFDDVSEFSAQIAALLDDKDQAAARAATLKKNISKMFSEKAYLASIKKALARHDL